MTIRRALCRACMAVLVTAPLGMVACSGGGGPSSSPGKDTTATLIRCEENCLNLVVHSPNTYKNQDDDGYGDFVKFVPLAGDDIAQIEVGASESTATSLDSALTAESTDEHGKTFQSFHQKKTKMLNRDAYAISWFDGRNTNYEIFTLMSESEEKTPSGEPEKTIQANVLYSITLSVIPSELSTYQHDVDAMAASATLTPP